VARRLGEGRQPLLQPEQRDRDEDPARGRYELSTHAASPSRPAAISRPGEIITQGLVTAYLTLIVLLPLSAVVWQSTKGERSFWDVVTEPQALSALKLTLVVSVLVALVNAVVGTLIAWVLVRDEFRGKSVVNAVIDLPFALPTIVAGLTLLALYGPKGPFGIDVAFTRAAILLALLFVTLPFVVRTVQPVLLELDREMEEAAASLGANALQVFRRVVFPNLFPAVLSGVALAFARAIGEFGSVVLISGNLPFKTEVASVYIFGRIESGDPSGAAAVSVVLLVVSFAALLLIGGLRRRVTRHDRVG
jgi:sulfate transport system permease protein